jgi:hypothetical protein
MAALTGLLADATNWVPIDYAKGAYKIADAMLAEREKWK